VGANVMNATSVLLKGGVEEESWVQKVYFWSIEERKMVCYNVQRVAMASLIAMSGKRRLACSGAECGESKKKGCGIGWRRRCFYCNPPLSSMPMCCCDE